MDDPVLLCLLLFALGVPIARRLAAGRGQTEQPSREEVQSVVDDLYYDFAGNVLERRERQTGITAEDIRTEFMHRSSGVPWFERDWDWLAKDTAWLEDELDLALGLKSRPTREDDVACHVVATGEIVRSIGCPHSDDEVRREDEARARSDYHSVQDYLKVLKRGARDRQQQRLDWARVDDVDEPIFGPGHIDRTEK